MTYLGGEPKAHKYKKLIDRHDLLRYRVLSHCPVREPTSPTLYLQVRLLHCVSIHTTLLVQPVEDILAIVQPYIHRL